MERVRLMTHSGKQILLVDLAHCSAAEVEKIVRGLPDHLSKQPPRSALLITDFTGASFDEDCLRTMKETAIFDKPYVKKSAWIGSESLPTAFRQDVSKFSGREFSVFRTLIDAMEWLAKD